MRMQDAANLVENDPELQARVKSDPVNTLKTMAASPLATDVAVYRVAAGHL